MNPGVVGTDTEDCEIDGLLFVGEGGKAVAHGGIASEEDSALWRIDNITVIATVAINSGACAPMAGLHGTQMEGASGKLASPGEFIDLCKAAGNQPPGSRGGDDAGMRGGEGAEGGFIEMIEVRVGEQDKVWAGETCGVWRWQKPPQTQRKRSYRDADAMGENRIGKNPLPSDPDKHRGVPKPRGCQQCFAGRGWWRKRKRL